MNKLINCFAHGLEYPIGTNMRHNNPVIREMADVLGKHLKNEDIDIDTVTLVVTGSSGAIIGAIISHILDIKKVWHVKKNGETHHRSDEMYNFDSDDYLVFVDDFIASGETYFRVLNKLRDESSRKHFDCLIVGGTGYGGSFTAFVNDLPPFSFVGGTTEYSKRMTIAEAGVEYSNISTRDLEPEVQIEIDSDDDNIFAFLGENPLTEQESFKITTEE